MDGAEADATVVAATLPGGVPIRVEVSGPGLGDEMASAGLGDLDLSLALDAVAALGSVVFEKLKSAKPTRATAELRLGFAVEAGKLVALWLGGKSEASLTVTLEWSEHLGGPAS